MRQSLAEIEAAFVEQRSEDRERAERLQRRVEQRSRQRQAQRVRKRGSMRFWLVLLVLLGTAVLVTYAMFQALYYVMG